MMDRSLRHLSHAKSVGAAFIPLGMLVAALAGMLLLFACSPGQKDGEEALARVGNEYLYPSDIEELAGGMPAGADSALLAGEIIDQWIRQRLLLKQAGKNLSSDQMNFERQLEEYRNSLIIYTYEKELIRQKLDTLVTDADIRQYYDAHQADFELKDNIVKVLYVKVPKESPANSARIWIRSEKPDDRKKLQDFCHKYAVNYYLDDQNWLLFNDILKEIPIKTYNQEEYLKNNRYIEIEDSLYNYLLNIRGFLIRESVSPLSFEYDNIRNIIINKRKLELIGNMRNDLYNDALKRGEFEVYKNPGSGK